MDYEKAYKEALNRAKLLKYNPKKVLIECENIPVSDYIFPELKESEDERIRKWIIGVLSTYEHDKDLRNAAVTWLEKQGEKKPDNVETKFKVKYAGSEYSVQEVKDIAGITFYGIEDELNHIDYIKADSCEIINGGYGIKENGCSFPTKSIMFSEQKPSEREGFVSIPFGAFDSELYESMITIPDGCVATIEANKIHIKREGKSATEAIKEEKVDNSNKVELKFHEGDYVVNIDCGKVLRISEVLNHGYLFENGDYSTFDNADKEYRMWNINDAKNGDVLCYKDEISLYKYDIKNCTKEETTFGGFVYHCCYDGKRFIMDSLYSLMEQDKMDIHPATKEQCDILFTKMKEAGYTWDSKKKELEPLYKCEVTPHSKKGLEMTT